jgi:hypothetical protein
MDDSEAPNKVKRAEAVGRGRSASGREIECSVPLTLTGVRGADYAHSESFTRVQRWW